MIKDSPTNYMYRHKISFKFHLLSRTCMLFQITALTLTLMGVAFAWKDSCDILDNILFNILDMTHVLLQMWCYRVTNSGWFSIVCLCRGDSVQVGISIRVLSCKWTVLWERYITQVTNKTIDYSQPILSAFDRNGIKKIIPVCGLPVWSSTLWNVYYIFNHNYTFVTSDFYHLVTRTQKNSQAWHFK